MRSVLRSTRLPYRFAQAARSLNERFPALSRQAITLRESGGPVTLLLESEEILGRIAPATVVYICGWRFRAPQALQKHAAAIRNYFRPEAGIADLAAKAVQSLRQKADVIVGVHIRHGDYRTFKKGQYFFPTEVYADWLTGLNRQLAPRKAAFLICSDEPRSPEEFPGLNVGMGAENAVADLYALAQCDYLLGPPSTFTQWASFYGNRPMLHVEKRETVVNIDRFEISDLCRIP